jgi:hypothetical protein
VESTLRGTMAWDAMEKGLDDTAVLAKVNKFHFDYGNLTDFERNAGKRVIPFYTWMSRNLPLQMEMMVSNPGKYTAYLHAKRNVEYGSTPDQNKPGFFNELGAMQITNKLGKGANNYLTPDLPFITAINQVESLAGAYKHPYTLLEDASPLIKTPIEVYGHKQIFADLPIDTEKDQPVPNAWTKVPGVIEGLVALGKLGRDPVTGEPMMSEQDGYIVEQAIPMMGRLRRLFPSEDKYTERRTASVLSFFFGIGYRTLTPSLERSALYERDGSLQTMITELKANGTIVAPEDKPPKPAKVYADTPKGRSQRRKDEAKAAAKAAAAA